MQCIILFILLTLIYAGLMCVAFFIGQPSVYYRLTNDYVMCSRNSLIEVGCRCEIKSQCVIEPRTVQSECLDVWFKVVNSRECREEAIYTCNYAAADIQCKSNSFGVSELICDEYCTIDIFIEVLEKNVTQLVRHSFASFDECVAAERVGEVKCMIFGDDVVFDVGWMIEDVVLIVVLNIMYIIDIFVLMNLFAVGLLIVPEVSRFSGISL